MRRLMALATGLAALAWCFFIAVPPASAFPLTTCTATITSMDASGNVISTATGGGAGGTRDDPLVVDPKGTVEWTATTGGSPISHASYHVEIFGVPTPLGGSMKGDSVASSNSDSIKVHDVLPFDIVGLVYVSGGVEMNGSTYCAGSGWIKLRGDPIGTPGFVAGAALGLIGIATVLASGRGDNRLTGAFGGIIGGAIGGAGLALLSGVTGILPFDKDTPLLEVITSLILGLVIGTIKFGDLFHRTPVSLIAEAGGIDPGKLPPEPPATPPAAPPPPPPDFSATTTAATASADAALAAAAAALAGAKKAADTVSSAAPEPKPKPGIDELRHWRDGLYLDQQDLVRPLFDQGEAILRTGPGILTIPADVFDRFRSNAMADSAAEARDLGKPVPEPPPAVKFEAGSISIDGPLGKLRATPNVKNGKLALDFLDLSKIDVSSEEGLGELIQGFGAQGAAKLNLGPGQAINWLLDQVNTAVANARQSVASVSVTQAGITITTAPAIH